MNASQNWKSAVAQIERLQTAKGRRQTGCCSIEGLRLHERALRAGLSMLNVVAANRLLQSPTPREAAILAELEKAGSFPTAVPDEVVTRLTNGRDLGALIGVVNIPQPTSLPARLKTNPNGRFLALVDVVDPGNVGALVRTAHAAGCCGLLTTGRSDPYHPRAVRTSMGSIFKLPVIPAVDSHRLLKMLNANRVRTVGTAVKAGVPLPETTLPKTAAAVLMGNEYYGLPEPLIAQLDLPISIPMAEGVDSFSVNAAAAIILYQLGFAE